jgi:hypothetical protein
MGEDALIIVGAALLLVGILGGGFELKELKVPTVSKLVRFTSLIAGFALTIMGYHLRELPGPQGSASPAGTADPTPRQPVPGDTSEVPKETTREPVPSDPKADIIAAIRTADNIEAQAMAFLDTSILARAYTGEALRNEVNEVERLMSNGVYRVSELKDQQVGTIQTDASSAEVELTETWSSVYYWIENRECAWQEPSHPMPQTMRLQRQENGWMVSSILFDIKASTPEQVKCE